MDFGAHYFVEAGALKAVWSLFFLGEKISVGEAGHVQRIDLSLSCSARAPLLHHGLLIFLPSICAIFTIIYIGHRYWFVIFSA